MHHHGWSLAHNSYPTVHSVLLSWLQEDGIRPCCPPTLYLFHSSYHRSRQESSVFFEWLKLSLWKYLMTLQALVSQPFLSMAGSSWILRGVFCSFHSENLLTIWMIPDVWKSSWSQLAHCLFSLSQPVSVISRFFFSIPGDYKVQVFLSCSRFLGHQLLPFLNLGWGV